MRASNIFLSRFAKKGVGEQQATISGISIKTIILTLVTIITGAISVAAGMRIITVEGFETLEMAMPLWIAFGVRVFIGMFAAMLGLWIPKIANVMSFTYAIAQGIYLGVISAIIDIVFPGVVFMAAGATVIIFLIMLLLYRNNTFRNINLVYKVMMAIMIGVFACSILFLIMFFITGGLSIPWYIPLLISLAVLIYASLMLVMDFEYAVSVVNAGLDKRYEWVASLSLLITILWIYVKALRILIILLGNRRR